MSQTKVDKLTSEQEALIPVYREKWKAIALSTEHYDWQDIYSVVATYMGINKEELKEELNFLYDDSPYAVLNRAKIQPKRYPWSQSPALPICQLET